MEMPNVGSQCEQTYCNRLDFLPINCSCGKKFCAEHFNEHTLECSSTRSQNSSIKQLETSIKSTVFICSQLNCKEKSVIPLMCEKCNQHFCVAHRHVMDCMNESKDEIIRKSQSSIDRFNSAKAIVDKKIDEKINKIRENPKKSDMAEKLMLLRLKSKAVGLKSIPPTDRVYFNVYHSGGSHVTPIFISKTWSVGKAIDAIAEECKIENKNNISTALKLGLFKLKSDQVVTNSLADLVNNLLVKKQLINGENLILEYVKDGCIKIDV